MVYKNTHQLYTLHCTAILKPSTPIRTLCQPLLSSFMLRRVKGQTVVFLGQEHTIAQSIPPFRITTHELSMNSEQARLYIKAHDDLIGDLSRRGKRVENDDNTRGNIHMGVHRFLCHATTDPALDSYRKVSAKKVTASALAKLAAQPDGGYAAHHKITRHLSLRSNTTTSGQLLA